MGKPTEDNIYGYNASVAAAVIFNVLNGLLLGHHGWLCFWLARHRPYRHRYTIPLFVAALLAAGNTFPLPHTRHQLTLSL